MFPASPYRLPLRQAGTLRLRTSPAPPRCVQQARTACPAPQRHPPLPRGRGEPVCLVLLPFLPALLRLLHLTPLCPSLPPRARPQLSR
jgi:hypothetical protein